MLQLRRFPDWPQRLARAIAERRNIPHTWGSNDCALFAADCVAAMTGADLGAGFRGRYSDEAGAAEILKAHSWADLSDLADSYFPRRDDRPRRGDVALVDGRFGPFLGMVWQGGVIGPGPRHVITWPMKTAATIWSVG